MGSEMCIRDRPWLRSSSPTSALHALHNHHAARRPAGHSTELYEAAHVDGAGVTGRFWYVTLSQLRHVIAVVFLFATIWMVNDFALIYIMTEGARPSPPRSFPSPCTATPSNTFASGAGPQRR